MGHFIQLSRITLSFQHAELESSRRSSMTRRKSWSISGRGNDWLPTGIDSWVLCNLRALRRSQEMARRSNSVSKSTQIGSFVPQLGNCRATMWIRDSYSWELGRAIKWKTPSEQSLKMQRHFVRKMLFGSRDSRILARIYAKTVVKSLASW